MTAPIGYFINRKQVNGWNERLEMLPCSNHPEPSYTATMNWIEIPANCISKIVRKSPSDVELPEGIINIQELEFGISLNWLREYAMEIPNTSINTSDNTILDFNSIDRNILTWNVEDEAYKQQVFDFYNSVLYPEKYIDMEIDFSRTTGWAIGRSDLSIFHDFPSGTTPHKLIHRKIYNTWIYYSDQGLTADYTQPIKYICKGVFVQKPEIEQDSDLKNLSAYKNIKCSDAIQYCFENFSDWDVMNMLSGDKIRNSADLVIDIYTANYTKFDMTLHNSEYILNQSGQIENFFCEKDYLYQQMFYLASVIFYKYVMNNPDYINLSKNYTILDTQKAYFKEPYFFHQFYAQDKTVNTIKPDLTLKMEWIRNEANSIICSQDAFEKVDITDTSTRILYLLICTTYYTATLGSDYGWKYFWLNFGGLLSVNAYESQENQYVTIPMNLDTALITLNGLNITATTADPAVFTISSTTGITDKSMIEFVLSFGVSLFTIPSELRFLLSQKFIINIIDSTTFNIQYIQKPDLENINQDTIENKYKNIWDFLKNQYNCSGGVAQIKYDGNLQISDTYNNTVGFYIDLKDTQDIVETIPDNGCNLIQTYIDDAHLIEHHAVLRGSKSNLENMQQDDDSNPEYISYRSFANAEANYSVPIWNGYTIPTEDYRGSPPFGHFGYPPLDWGKTDYGFPLLARKLYYFDTGLMGESRPLSVSLYVDIMKYKTMIIDTVKYYVLNNNGDKPLYTSSNISQLKINTDTSANSDWTKTLLNPLKIIQKTGGYGVTLNKHKMKNFARPDQFIITGKVYLNYLLSDNDTLIDNYAIDPISCGNHGKIFQVDSNFTVSQGFNELITNQFPSIKYAGRTNYDYILIGCEIEEDTKLATIKLFFCGKQEPIL